MSDELTIGLDIGGTKMALVVADRLGNIKASQTLPTRPGEAFNDTASRVTTLLNKYLEQFDTVCGIGNRCARSGQCSARHRLTGCQPGLGKYRHPRHHLR